LVVRGDPHPIFLKELVALVLNEEHLCLHCRMHLMEIEALEVGDPLDLSRRLGDLIQSKEKLAGQCNDLLIWTQIGHLANLIQVPFFFLM
jgi:hypothetical protein